MLRFSEEEVLVALHVHLEVSTKGTGSANQMITSNSFVGVDLVGHLALLVLSTRGMVSAEVNKC